MKKILSILTLILLYGCTTFKEGYYITTSTNEIGGFYFDGTNKEFQTFRYEYSKGIYQISDTFSKGTWKKERNYLILNGDKKQQEPYKHIDVVESNSGSNDSVYINFDFPIPCNLSNKGENRLFACDPLYEIHVLFKDSTCTELYDKNFYSNRISFTKNCATSKEFNIVINPNYKHFQLYDYTPIPYLLTERYKIKDSSKNTFSIHIRNFDKNYFYARPFYDEYIIRKKNNLLLGGVKYKYISKELIKQKS